MREPNWSKLERERQLKDDAVYSARLSEHRRLKAGEIIDAYDEVLVRIVWDGWFGSGV
jgi:hypothetical protein